MADQSQQPFASQLIAGDDWSWTLALPDYPASTYTLKYFLRGPATDASLDLTATAGPDGSTYLLSAAGSDTEKLPAGLYAWQQCVFLGDGKRTELARGQVQILADIASQTAPYDARSSVKKTLDAIQANIQGTAGRVEKQYMVAGRELQLRSFDELTTLEGVFLNRFKREQIESGQAAGDSNLIRAGFPAAGSRVGVWSK
jgi:hypothetical protein